MKDGRRVRELLGDLDLLRDSIIRAYQDRPMPIKVLAQLIGINTMTLSRFMTGRTKQLSYNSIIKMQTYLIKAREGEKSLNIPVTSSKPE